MATPAPRPPETVPKKIYYSISEVSEYTGVEPHVLRYWETKFSRLSPKRVGGNQRKYTRHDLDLIYEIIHLLYTDGYTLDGAEKKLRAGLSAVKAEREEIERNGNGNGNGGDDANGENDTQETQVGGTAPQTEAVKVPAGIPRDEVRLIRNEIAAILKILS